MNENLFNVKIIVLKSTT